MKLVVSLIILFITIGISQAALYPLALKVEDFDERGTGQGVKVTVDDSDSVRRLEFYFIGSLKPTNDKGEVFLSNAKQSIVGFNVRPATQNQHTI